MAEGFQLEIATPNRLLVRETVSEAQIPASEGYIGVLPQHTPLLSELGSGELSYLVGGRRQRLVVHGGWVEVLPDHVRVLADEAELIDEIDLERARMALRDAQRKIMAGGAPFDIAAALNAMHRAQERLRAAERKP